MTKPVIVMNKASSDSVSVCCSMARLDRVKNLSGLAAWFAGSPRLRQLVNLVIVGECLQPLLLLLPALFCSESQPLSVSAMISPFGLFLCFCLALALSHTVFLFY